ncbi:hypothetical protein NECAME_14835 [Necator americanus]|uniref:Uncharacterized protein n=1 Tax=Necator americanus TaxID=51031 RepID=W2SNR8_NECAM|nr:hypothetical protein NECAME_14835 [Necator americanus]ETN70342.1 hypothetical protein NECAME_14835 [Necator americanus]
MSQMISTTDVTTSTATDQSASSTDPTSTSSSADPTLDEVSTTDVTTSTATDQSASSTDPTSSSADPTLGGISTTDVTTSITFAESSQTATSTSKSTSTPRNEGFTLLANSSIMTTAGWKTTPISSKIKQNKTDISGAKNISLRGGKKRPAQKERALSLGKLIYGTKN